MSERDPNSRLSIYISAGLAVGALFGIFIGLLLDNIGAGVAIGGGAGVAIGVGLGSRNRSNDS